MSAVSSFRRVGLGLLPLALLSLTFCKPAEDAAPKDERLTESRVYESGTLVTRSTFTYDGKGNITEALVRNYAGGVATDSFNTVYTYAADGRLLSAVSPVNSTVLGYDATDRYTACHTVWADSATHPNFKSSYAFPAAGTLQADSLFVRRTQGGATPTAENYRMAYKYVNGVQTGIASADGRAVGRVRRTADGTRFAGMVLKEGDKYSFTALVYSHELAHEDFMQPFLAIQHVAAAQCPYFSPKEKMDMDGMASHLLDAFSVSDTSFTMPTPTYTSAPEGKVIKHTVQVGGKTYVYYTNG